MYTNVLLSSREKNFSKPTSLYLSKFVNTAFCEDYFCWLTFFSATLNQGQRQCCFISQDQFKIYLGFRNSIWVRQIISKFTYPIVFLSMNFEMTFHFISNLWIWRFSMKSKLKIKSWASTYEEKDKMKKVW